MAPTRYLAPGWVTRNLFNPLMEGLTQLGVSVRGSRQLAVRGRTSGEWRTVPVGAQHPRRRWRELRLGRRVEPITVAEVPDADKVPVLREYVRRWKAEVGQFFDGVTADSSDDELAAIAPGFPVFRLVES